MCDCLQSIGKIHESANEHYGRAAKVNVKLRIDVGIRRYVKGENELRLSKHRRYASAPMNFCPVCGTKYSEPQRFVSYTTPHNEI